MSWIRTFAATASSAWAARPDRCANAIRAGSTHEAILMNAAYLDPRVKLDPATRALRVEFEIRNDSTETWKAAEGFAVGYHLFDPETGTLIVDGARVSPVRDIASGERERFCFDLELPPEDGRYRLIFSAMREGVCW